MALQFEKFTEPGRSHLPRVSIRAGGQLGFSAGAMAKFRIAEYKFAVLYFEPNHRIIGIKLRNEAEDGAIKIRFRGGLADISARAFLEKFEISHDKTLRYDATWNEDYGMIFINLKKDGDQHKE